MYGGVGAVGSRGGRPRARARRSDSIDSSSPHSGPRACSPPAHGRWPSQSCPVSGVGGWVGAAGLRGDAQHPAVRWARQSPECSHTQSAVTQSAATRPETKEQLQESLWSHLRRCSSPRCPPSAAPAWATPGVEGVCGGRAGWDAGRTPTGTCTGGRAQAAPPTAGLDHDPRGKSPPTTATHPPTTHLLGGARRHDACACASGASGMRAAPHSAAGGLGKARRGRPLRQRTHASGALPASARSPRGAGMRRTLTLPHLPVTCSSRAGGIAGRAQAWLGGRAPPSAVHVHAWMPACAAAQAQAGGQAAAAP